MYEISGYLNFSQFCASGVYPFVRISQGNGNLYLFYAIVFCGDGELFLYRCLAFGSLLYDPIHDCMRLVFNLNTTYNWL